MTTDHLTPTASPSWAPVQKPAEIAESRLIEAILSNTFPVNSTLPGERDLAEQLGITRPTLREALQRLARDGWLEIHQGKPTRVRDYWHEGKLGVLGALSEHPDYLPENFIPDLLSVRLAIAPMYTQYAVEKQPQAVLEILSGRAHLADSAERFAIFDWRLQHQMTVLSENPIFTLILNGFKDLFLNLAPIYFSTSPAREHSLTYYRDLSEIVRAKKPKQAALLTEKIMRETLDFWQKTHLI